MAKILIVSPDKVQASLWSDALHRAGMPTIGVADGEATMREIERETPALIVLDLAVDDGQGTKLCAAIREEEGGELVPILLVGTGAEGVKNFGEALAEGADYYFDKPVDVNLLLDKARSHVGVDRDASTVVGDPAVLVERVEKMLDLGQRFADGLLPPEDGEADDKAAAPGREDTSEEDQKASGLDASQLFDDVTEGDGDEAGGLLPPEPEPAADVVADPMDGLDAQPEPGEDRQEPDLPASGFLRAPAGQAEAPRRTLRVLEDQLMEAAEQSDPVADKESALAQREMELVQQVSGAESPPSEEAQAPSAEAALEPPEDRDESEARLAAAREEAMLAAGREAETAAKGSAETEAGLAAEDKARQAAAERALEKAQVEAMLLAQGKAEEEATKLGLAEALRRGREAGRPAGDEAGSGRARLQARETAAADAEARAFAEAQGAALAAAERDSGQKACATAAADVVGRIETEARLVAQARRAEEERAAVLLRARKRARAEARAKALEAAGDKAQREGLQAALADAEEQGQAEAGLEAGELAARQARGRAAEDARRQLEKELIEEREEHKRRAEAEASPKEPPPLEADQVWREAMDEFEVAERDLGSMARLASSWADDRLAEQSLLEFEELSLSEDGPLADAQAEGEGEAWVRPTVAGTGELSEILAREAARARDLAAQSDADDDDMLMQVTIPSLPPKPELRASKSAPVSAWQVKSMDEAGTSGQFDREKTEDLVFDFAGGDLLTSQECPVLQEQGESFAKPDEQTSPRLVSLEQARAALQRQAENSTGSSRSTAPAFDSDSALEPTEQAADFFGARSSPQLKPADPEQVDLAEEIVPAVLFRMLRQSVTGKVLFVSGGVEKQVFFEEGVPVAVRSSLRSDRLEELLLRENWIDKEAYAEARVKDLGRARALAAYLVERAHLRPEELFPLVRRHLEHCLLGLFEWQKGRAVFEAQLVEDSEKVRLSRPVAALILDGIRRKFLLDRMQLLLGGASSLLAPVPIDDRAAVSPDPSQLDLSEAERDVLRLVNGMRPIEEIGFLSGQKAEAVYRVLLAAQVLGLVSLVAKGLPGGAKSQEESLRRDLDIRRRRLLAKFDQIHQASYFEFLGVDEDATSFEIEAASQRLAREFHPAHFNHPALRDLEGKLSMVKRALDEAREVLSDELLRLGYRDSLSRKK